MPPSALFVFMAWTRNTYLLHVSCPGHEGIVRYRHSYTHCYNLLTPAMNYTCAQMYAMTQLIIIIIIIIPNCPLPYTS
jgi:hypothetical protein